MGIGSQYKQNGGSQKDRFVETSYLVWVRAKNGLEGNSQTNTNMATRRLTKTRRSWIEELDKEIVKKDIEEGL